MNELNAVAIVGSGEIKLVNDDGTFTTYVKQAFNVLDYAKILNDMQDYFPVFGLSWGHLIVHLYETKDPAILSTSTTGMVAETPNFLEVKSKMFNLTTEDNLAKYKN